MEQTSPPATDQLASARSALRRLSVYRSLLSDPVVQRLSELLDRLAEDVTDPAACAGAYHALFAALTGTERTTGTGDAWQDHLLNLILWDENIFSRLAEQGAEPSPGLRAAVESDLTCLQSLYRLSAATLRQDEAWPLWVDINILPGVQSPLNAAGHDGTKAAMAATADWRAGFDTLAAAYRTAGTGRFGRYQAFRWTREGLTGDLEPVSAPDPIRLSELIGYEVERAEVIANTQHFLAGYRANNVLLYGDRGTGKSSTIKAILNEYAPAGLRLVEMPKQHLRDFPSLIRLLQNRPQRFIVYVDDLSFEDDESEYKDLKAILEGGLEARPANVVIYATSNRRHLVRERFSDRGAPREIADDDEIRQQDTLQEKLSLADRFGIALTFTAPDQERYLQIVEGLSAQRGLVIDRPVLRHQAIQWELWHNGRSGRTARQFIDWLEGKLGLEGSA